MSKRAPWEDLWYPYVLDDPKNPKRKPKRSRPVFGTREYHDDYLRRLRKNKAIREPICTTASLESLLDQVEQSAKQKLEAEGFPGDYFKLEQRFVEILLESKASHWQRLLKKQFKTTISQRKEEELPEYVRRLMEDVKEKSLERATGEFAQHLKDQHGIEMPRSGGEDVYDYSRRLRVEGWRYGLKLEWERPKEKPRRKPALGLDRNIIPQGLELQSQDLAWEAPANILNLEKLLRWVMIARFELLAGNLIDVARALYQVGTLSALAGIEEAAVTSLKQQRGFKKKRSQTTRDKESHYREYVSDFNRIEAVSRNKDTPTIVTELANKYSVTKRTIYRALKESKKL